jgi:hypothetical protein
VCDLGKDLATIGVSTFFIVVGIGYLFNLRGIVGWHLRASRRIGRQLSFSRNWTAEGEKIFERFGLLFLRFMGLVAALAGVGGLLSLFIPGLRAT